MQVRSMGHLYSDRKVKNRTGLGGGGGGGVLKQKVKKIIIKKKKQLIYN
jgi:hypothetical protein